MERRDFTSRSPGVLREMPEGYLAFLPAPLPPELPSSWEISNAVAQAAHALSQLAGATIELPNPRLLVYPFIRREAVHSSRIEGSQTTLDDLFAFESTGHSRAPRSDVEEVRNYVAALDYGIERLKTFPLSLRLIRELHAHLMKAAGASYATPGEFRRSQNWIGRPGSLLSTATYVPPPVAEMHEALAQFEAFLHARSPYPDLVTLALEHYQFEAIHPFIDGNGRVGRLLISLLLAERQLLSQPLLYLSAYIEKHRSIYYQLLIGVTRRGEWDEWVLFFLDGIRTQAEDALTKSRALLAYREELRGWATASPMTSSVLLQLIDLLLGHPVVTVDFAVRQTGRSGPAVRKQLERLTEAGILTRNPEAQRDRVYAAPQILELLSRAESDLVANFIVS